MKDELFTTAGALGIRPVRAIGADPSVSTDCARNADPCAATTEASEALVLDPATVTGDHVRAAKAVDPQGQWGVQLDFTTAGAAALKKLTDTVACQDDEQLKRIAILLDGKLLTAPTLGLACGGSLSDSVEISGGFDHDKAAQLAALVATPLPAGVTMVSSTP